MSRRSRGEGSIYPAPDGNGYIARIDLAPGPDGKRRQRKRRVSTKAAAVEALRDMMKDAEAGIAPGGRMRTVATAVDTYLVTRPNENRARKTIEQERWRANLIVAGLGGRRLGDLAVVDCDRFLALARQGEYGRRPLDKNSVTRVHRLLIKVVRNEMRHGNLASNVAELAELPVFGEAYDDRPSEARQSATQGDSSTSSRRALSYQEFAALEAAASEVAELLVDLSGRNGLRPAEARGLCWDRIDTSARTLTVATQMSSYDQLTYPKTRRSIRTIPIDDQTVVLLHDWASKQAAWQTAAEDLWTSEPNLILTTRFGGPVSRMNLSRALEAACRDASVDRATPYELRHTAISYQVDARVEPWRIADWAGTSEAMIEMIYRHRLRRVVDVGPAPIRVVPLGPEV